MLFPHGDPITIFNQCLQIPEIPSESASQYEDIPTSIDESRDASKFESPSISDDECDEFLVADTDFELEHDLKCEFTNLNGVYSSIEDLTDRVKIISALVGCTFYSFSTGLSIRVGICMPT